MLISSFSEISYIGKLCSCGLTKMLNFLPEGGVFVLWSKNASLNCLKKKPLPDGKATHKTVMSNSSSWAEMEGCSKHFWFSVTRVSFYRLRL